MKLERISDNQIRCTLNKNDLADRELKLSELAYGSEKAKDLFREVMAQASDELGFEANDIPLIIEAIPVSGDCIILIVTKVEDPEELDTRFARFAPSSPDSDDDFDEDSDEDASDMEAYIGADEILDIFKEIQKKLMKNLTEVTDEDDENDTDVGNVSSKTSSEHASSKETSDSKKTSSSDAINITRIFSFNRLSEVSELAAVLSPQAPKLCTLYKHPKTGTYYLVMDKGDLSPEDFNKICNITTEYGQREKMTYATKAYFDEHYEIIIKNNALNILAQI